MRSARGWVTGMAGAVTLLGIVAVAGSCSRAATQLVVVVDTDLTEAARACFGVRVSRIVDGSVEPGATRTFFESRDVGVPFSFGVSPPDGLPSARVEIAVEALPTCADPAAGARLVRRAVRTGFLVGQTLRVPLFLSASCGAGCVETLTCPASGDMCETVPTIEPEELAPVEPRTELSDAGAPMTDAGEPLTDASVTGSCTPRPAEVIIVAPSSVVGAAIPTDQYTLEAIEGVGWRAFTRRSDTEVWAQRVSLELDANFNDFPLDLPLGGVASGISSVQGPTPTSSIVLVGDSTTIEATRHLYTHGGMDVATDIMVPGAPIDGAAARLGADALFATRNSQIIITRVPATADPIAITTETSGNTISLASRSDGSALYAIGGSGNCLVRAVSAAGAVGGAVRLPFPCDRAAMAELGSNVLLLFVDSGAAYAVLLDGATLTAMGTPTNLGAAVRGDRLSVLANPARTSARMVWARDATTISTQSIDGAMVRGPLEEISFATVEGSGDASRIRAARSGRRTVITFPSAPATGAIVWAMVCD